MSIQNDKAMAENSEADVTDLPLSDALLVSQIAAGHREVEQEFVARYQPRVRAMLLTNLRNPDMVADLTQDVLMGAICALRRNQLRDAAKLSSFVLAITKNMMIDFNRNSARNPSQLDLPDDLPYFDRTTEKAEEEKKEALALKAIATLDETDRLILHMTLLDGLKPGVIAEQLNMRPDLVRQRKLRATRQIVKVVQRLSQNEQIDDLLSGENQ